MADDTATDTTATDDANDGLDDVDRELLNAVRWCGLRRAPRCSDPDPPSGRRRFR